MKKNYLAVVLSLLLTAGLVAGCAGSGQGSPAGNQASVENQASAGDTASDTAGSADAEDSQKSLLDDALESPDGEGSGSGGRQEPETGSAQSETPEQQEPEAGSADTAISGKPEDGVIPVGSSLDGAEYVLIYDPLIYDENDLIKSKMETTLDTGDLSSQIVVGMSRADDMGLENLPVLLSQRELMEGLDFGAVDRSSDKAAGMNPIYSKGERHSFYCSASDPSLNNRTLEEFECVYEGEHCYIWSYNDSVSEEQAQELGIEFDGTVYDRDVSLFGPARFTDEGGKVNILMYPMMTGVGGFFTMTDIFAEGELPPESEAVLLPNYGHAIININSDYMMQDMAIVKSTLAHEFQHLICASEYFYYEDTPMMRTWLNESMSAYAEEMVYPGIKNENHYNEMMYLSNAFRTGQSLYNFDTKNDEFIGSYGAVYLFSQYMRQLAGDDVFTKVHEYWRTSYDAGISEAGALVSAVPENAYQTIDQTCHYPEEVRRGFGSTEEEWMSKLTLSFYIETLSGKLAGLEEYEDYLHAYCLYSEIDPQLIQGGGRMLVQTENGSFQVPESADSGLIYIGLDSDFHPIPGLVIAGK